MFSRFADSDAAGLGKSIQMVMLVADFGLTCCYCLAQSDSW
jgi:hypothetical protein